MGKSITITCSNRPQYFSKMLESLRRIKLIQGYKLYCFIEPFENNQETIKLCESIDFIEKELVFNEKVYGISENPYRALSYVFERGNEINVYLEEDLIVSPDILHMAEWYSLYKNRDNYLCLTYFNGCSLEEKYESMNLILETIAFSPLGFCLSKEMFYAHFSKVWFLKNADGSYPGWDVNVNNYGMNSKLKSLVPIVSRSTHIGEIGVHLKSDTCLEYIELNKMFRSIKINKDFVNIGNYEVRT